MKPHTGGKAGRRAGRKSTEREKVRERSDHRRCCSVNRNKGKLVLKETAKGALTKENAEEERGSVRVGKWDGGKRKKSKRLEQR